MASFTNWTFSVDMVTTFELKRPIVSIAVMTKNNFGKTNLCILPVLFMQNKLKQGDTDRQANKKTQIRI